MAKTKISEFSATPGNNTDIDGINLAEGCAPSGINDAIRELMSQLKDFQAGTAGDSFNGPVGTTTAAAGAFTTLSASSTVSGTGFSTYLASPPAIGGTTAAAGSFTTLSASGNVTLSGGTANGLAYLNGSKVLTTGSALTFDGTNFYTTGKAFIGGTADGGEKVQIESTSGAQLALRYAAGTTWSLQTNSGGGLQWNYNGSEQMRLTSTGLGIGTSSPDVKLRITGANVANKGQFMLDSTTFAQMSLYNGSTRYAQIYADVSGANTGMYIQTATAQPLIFSTSDTERMRLDSSGNLGLGVTPSASQASGVLFLKNNGQIAFSGPTSYFDTNVVYNNNADRYITNGTASRIAQLGGSFQFLTAPSGTAGNAISFTQAMTLDASGRLLLGSTSAAGGLASGTLQVGSGFADVNNTGSLAAPTIVTSGSLEFNFDGVGGTQRRGRITGNGTTNAGPYAGGLDFEYLGYNGSAYQWYTGARIDSSGNLLVGVTSSIASSSNTTAGSQLARTFAWFANEDATYFQRLGSDGTVQRFLRAATQVGSISVTSTTTTYNTSSDYRLKEDIQPMTGALAKVAALKPCTYKWKSDGSDGEGFIAHELAEVVPQCVTGEKDAVDADGNPQYQGIDTSFLVATLTAAIQEQQAIITALTARVSALESN